MLGYNAHKTNNGYNYDKQHAFSDLGYYQRMLKACGQLSPLHSTTYTLCLKCDLCESGVRS